MFDLSEYNLRQLDPQQGTKPLDFGGGGITGSVNLDGRLIAINTYHPEHGYITLTSIPPFPDEDRYNQKKVRAYRKSLVHNEGFGLQFEQEIVKREYFLIEDAIPFMRFTLADNTIAECVTLGKVNAEQYWRFSKEGVRAKYTGSVWLMRAAYTQLTEGGILPMPKHLTTVDASYTPNLLIRNKELSSFASFSILNNAHEATNGSIFFDNEMSFDISFSQQIQVDFHESRLGLKMKDVPTQWFPSAKEYFGSIKDNLILKRASVYADICFLRVSDDVSVLLTDHMLLPLSWNRDAYYTSLVLPDRFRKSAEYFTWLISETWRGTYSKRLRKPIPAGWGRSYLANGQQKDSRSYQLDQQIFPLLMFSALLENADDGLLEPDEIIEYQDKFKQNLVPEIQKMLTTIIRSEHSYGLYNTDETPADDDIPLNLHFSSHILLWYALRKIDQIYLNLLDEDTLLTWIETIHEQISKTFITEHKGKQIYSYATDGEGNHYLYHDANDIPLVMMPLWGFCDKDDPIWRNTIDFAFSSENTGFYDGVLGSVHTPAPWSLGDAQELILSKVIGDRERYQRVWERVEKAAQWDGALPEAYDANTFEVVSRHWFAWTNAMVAIADSISWDWQTEGEYAR